MSVTLTESNDASYFVIETRLQHKSTQAPEIEDLSDDGSLESIEDEKELIEDIGNL